MIFLLKDGNFKVFRPYMDDTRLAKKFRKHKENLDAVLVECGTCMHSDTYTIIQAENFKTSIKPFAITYSLALYNIDTPIDQEGTGMTRTIYIDNVTDFYAASSLLYQIHAFESVSDALSLGPFRVTFTSFQFEFGKKVVEWDPEKDDFIEFLSRWDMQCDTDTYLDASMASSKTEAIEAGEYIERFDPRSQTRSLRCYHHGRRYYLHLSQGRWSKTLNNPMKSDMIRDDGINAFCLCINNTGLVYMAAEDTAINLFRSDSASIIALTGTWAEYKGAWIISDRHEGKSEFTGYNLADILYMAVYLPQIWDIDRFLYGECPLHVSCEFIQDRFYYKQEDFNIPHMEEDRGLDLDLFMIYNLTLATPKRLMSFDD